MQIITATAGLCALFFNHSSLNFELQPLGSLLFCEDEQQGAISSADGIFWDIGQTQGRAESAGRGQRWVGGQ